MARRTPPPPLEIPREWQALEVYAPIADRWYPAWIEYGQITTICGVASYNLPVRVWHDCTARLDSVQLRQYHSLLSRYKNRSRAGTE